MPLPSGKIIQLLSEVGAKFINAREVLAAVGLDNGQFRELTRFLDMLVATGLLRYQRSGGYQVQRALKLVVGVVHIQTAGYGFVEQTPPTDVPADDIYISSLRLSGAMDGDTVCALLLPRQRGTRGKRQEGVVIEVTERARNTVVGVCKRQARTESIICYSEQHGLEFLVTDGAVNPVSADISLPYVAERLVDKVVILAIERYPGQDGSGQSILGRGHVVEVLGVVGDPAVDVRMVAHQQGIPTEFSDQVLLEAQQVAVAVNNTDYAGRVDLTQLPLVTIDGADARDFDDAVALQSTAAGCKLWVAIADVSHYVTPTSALDAEANERGTSVYFPSTCIPMLPEVLSNGMCSLKPDVERLAMAVEIDFDRNNQQVALKIYPAVMRSQARLTYLQVQQCLDGADKHEVAPHIATMLQQMAQLAIGLRSYRVNRGALDFDLPEAEIRFNDAGLPIYVGRLVRVESHRLIEEFMLAANEAVAAWVLERRSSALFRIHDAPDALALYAFQQFVAGFDLGFNIADDGVHPDQLQKLLQQVRGSDKEYIVNQILLRSMKQAQYSSENHGHFGLASAAYCHFTSPIRRYPDLIQHRIVRKLLEGDSTWPGESLEALAQHVTATERRAMLAEREIVDLRKCQFLVDKIGLRFSGYITGVTEFGFFVVLNEHFVEGLVHIRSIGDDFYSYEAEFHRLVGQRRRRVFQVGMAVDVAVKQVRPDHRQIDFELSDLVVPATRKNLGLKRRAKRGVVPKVNRPKSKKHR
jgi:ribonuclease R